ncbi:hypothetical protein Ga0100231_000850 [Opitutaceae bacterium TAV4]|nr:hypothetical protein Ga0100230_011900 [Opitutaceae bacterium TAV3]RRK01394.1 hypothetical protein Ga0100231_000850 [Opitutaceae bacterium TAV4]
MKWVVPVVIVFIAMPFAASVARSQTSGDDSAWLRQFERYAGGRVSEPSEPGGVSPEFSVLLQRLPEPTRWPILWQSMAETSARAETGSVAQRRLQAGVWLFAYLNGDRASIANDIQDRLPREPLASAPALRTLQRAAIPAAELSPRDRARRFNQALSDAEGRTVRPDTPPVVDVPDLVKLLSPGTAEALLTRGLKLPVVLNTPRGEETAALARRLALENVATLPVPQWKLVADRDRDPKGVALFEALKNRFPDNNENQTGYAAARSYYLAALVLGNRTDDAIKFVASLPRDAVIEIPAPLRDEIVRSNRLDAWWLTLQSIVRRAPSPVVWDYFYRASVQLGRVPAFVVAARQVSDDETLPAVARFLARRQLAATELAAADPAPGIARLRALLQEKQALSDVRIEQAAVADQLLAIADLQGDNALFDEALAAARRLIDLRRGADPWVYPVNYAAASSALAQRLLALKRPAEAFAVAKKALDDGSPTITLTAAERQQLLTDRLAALVALEKWSEAAAFLTNDPGWGVADVAGLIRTGATSAGKPAAWYVARVLVAQDGQNNKAAARRILEAQLPVTPSIDAVYESWLALAGIEARPLLDQLARQDRYESRPLVWKSQVEMMLGDTEAALATLRQAVGIDPADCGQPPGDRMRVYGFVAEALRRKDDLPTAELMDKVVKAARLSETADRWREAGLERRALDIYQESLQLFPKSYPTLWRTALELGLQGRNDEALSTFRRACEFMPDSINRLGTPCAPNVRLFGDPAMQRIAEQTFDRIALVQPNRPQISLLMGILREEQGQLAEAGQLYQHTVRIDPLQLGAWHRLAPLLDYLDLSARECDDVVMQISELDPAGLYTQPDFSRVNDLARLWRQLDKTNRRLAAIAAPETVWPLKAAREHLAKSPGDTVSEHFSNAARLSPSTYLVRHEFIRALEAYLATLR